MANCKHLKIKMNRSIECKLTGKTITWEQCKNCKLREYKLTNIKHIKKKTYKQNKLENNRFSILTDDLDQCIICGKSPVNKHEIFYGSKNRLNSIKYGLVIPLCTEEHHNQIDKKGIHFDKELNDYWHRKGQTAFNKVYPNLNFIDIFKRNYL